MAAHIELAAWREARDLAQTWQGRILSATSTDHCRVPSNELNAIVLSILAHCYDETDTMPVLLRVLFPGFTSLTPPFLISIAHVDKAGRVVADILHKNGWYIAHNMTLFDSKEKMQNGMRRVCDGLKFSDEERMEFFACIHKWCPADHRKDPEMNPLDPDAVRFKYH